MNLNVSKEVVKKRLVQMVALGIMFLMVRSCFMYNPEEVSREEIKVKLCKATDEYAIAYLDQIGIRLDSTGNCPCILYEAAKYHALGAVRENAAAKQINEEFVKDNLLWTPDRDTSDYLILEKTFVPWMD